MRLCRYNDNRIGLVEGAEVVDVTEILKELPPLSYPQPYGDQLIAALPGLRPRLSVLAKTAKRQPISSVAFKSPVANPSKIIAAPSNYQLHIDEGGRDAVLASGRKRMHIGEAGLFLKSNTSLVGMSEGVALRFPDRRNDHEAELGVVIGKTCEHVTEADALSVVAGYSMALDMVVRGPEERSLRKSIDTYSLLGPWLVTAEEIKDPDALEFSLWVNGELRQKSNTSKMIYSVRKQIAWATEFYTLYPGDIIMTGTPEGVGPVTPDDVMTMECEGIGRTEIKIRAYEGSKAA